MELIVLFNYYGSWIFFLFGIDRVATGKANHCCVFTRGPLVKQGKESNLSTIAEAFDFRLPVDS